MIRYIIIVSLFLFQNVYITSTKKILSQVGGEFINIADARFLVSITYIDPVRNTPRNRYTGVIIHEWFILTATECLRRYTEGTPIRVHFGRTRRNTGYCFEVDYVIPDADYISGITLFRLSDKIPDNIFTPILLPNSDFMYAAGRNITIMGYQRIGQRYSLSKVTTTLLDNDDRPRDMIFATNLIGNVSAILSRIDIGSPILLEGSFVGLVTNVQPLAYLITGVNIFQRIDYITSNIEQYRPR